MTILMTQYRAFNPDIKRHKLQILIGKFCASIFIISNGGCSSAPPNSTEQISIESEVTSVNLHVKNSPNLEILNGAFVSDAFKEPEFLSKGCTAGVTWSKTYVDGSSILRNEIFDQLMEDRKRAAKARFELESQLNQNRLQIEHIRKTIASSPTLQDPAALQRLRSQNRQYIEWKKWSTEVEEAVQKQNAIRSGKLKGLSTAEVFSIGMKAGQQSAVARSAPKFFYSPEIHTIPDNSILLDRNSKILKTKDEKISIAERQYASGIARFAISTNNAATTRTDLRDVDKYLQVYEAHIEPCLSIQSTDENLGRELVRSVTAYQTTASLAVSNNRELFLNHIKKAESSRSLETSFSNIVSTKTLKSILFKDPIIESSYSSKRSELLSSEYRTAKAAEDAEKAEAEKQRMLKISKFRNLAARNQPPDANEISELITTANMDDSRPNFKEVIRTSPTSFSAYSLNLLGIILYRSDYSIRNINISCKPKERRQICSGTQISNVRHYRLQTFFEREHEFPPQNWQAEFWWSDDGLKSSFTGGGFSFSQSSSSSRSTSDDVDDYHKRQREIIDEGRRKKESYDEFKKLNPRAH